MKILITGAAGFIGFNLAKYFLEKNDKIKIYGIDNFDDYYSVQLKKDRIKEIRFYNNFKFFKLNICNKKSLNQLLKKHKFDCIYHLAAQAGVRYSILHPQKYYDSNIVAFTNLLEASRAHNIKKIIYASSSSVYGESKKFPLTENLPINPKNVYALTKKINEELAIIYKETYKMNIVGIRFFTVFGEWGRPDMFMLKYLENIFFNSKFELFNNGNHYRDFTYIGDVVKILYVLKNLNFYKENVLNICSNNPIKITKIIDLINKVTNKKSKIKLVGMQQADIIKTHGSNKKIIKLTKIKYFERIDIGIQKTINWYKKYYQV
jgi:UDP-glucuronate 4-epimerase